MMFGLQFNASRLWRLKENRFYQRRDPDPQFIGDWLGRMVTPGCHTTISNSFADDSWLLIEAEFVDGDLFK